MEYWEPADDEKWMFGWTGAQADKASLINNFTWIRLRHKSSLFRSVDSIKDFPPGIYSKPAAWELWSWWHVEDHCRHHMQSSIKMDAA